MSESKLDKVLFSRPEKSEWLLVAVLFCNINWKVVFSIDFCLVNCFVCFIDSLPPKFFLRCFVIVLIAFRCVEFNLKQLGHLEIIIS